jgi:hypothetical protein
LQFRTNGQAEERELSAFAGSDAYRWLQNTTAPSTRPKSSWHFSRPVRVVLAGLLSLGLCSIAFLLWTLALRR